MEKEFIYSNLSDASISISPGLLNGKIGICLFLFHAGYADKAHEWLQAANGKLSAMKGNIVVEDGLCGTGLAISYLIQQGFIKGDINIVLQEIDDRVFQQLAYEQSENEFKLTQLIHIIYYLVARWKIQEKDSEIEYIFRSLIAQTLNKIYDSIDPRSINEPLYYSLGYALPQMLFVMDYLLSLNLCRQRIERMIGVLSPTILSTIPRIEANRLYLFCGIDSLFKHAALSEAWKTHRALLMNSIDVKYILQKEIGCKSIYLSNGVASLYFLLKQVEEYAGQMDEYRELIMKFIEASPEWKLLEENKAYCRSHLGLYDGMCGIALAYDIMEKEGEKEK
jgi:hypothetical protein